MIENFKKRLKEGLADIKEAETVGSYFLINEEFTKSGRKFMKPVEETNAKHLTDVIADLKTVRTGHLNAANDVGDQIEDCEAIRAELVKRDAEREKAEAKSAKK